MKKVLLIDVLAILHRSYFALPEMRSPTNQPTGALYGVLTSLIKVIKENNPHQVIACFDTPEQTARSKEVVEYKSNRAEAERDLVEQIKESYNLFEVLGIQCVEKAGHEADDVIGTIAKQNIGEYEIEILTGDSDLLQLVNDKELVSVFLVKTGNSYIKYNEKEVFEKYGFSPRQLIDYKGLSGDTSDNIKGIGGVGDITAKKLISKFSSVEGVYDALKQNDNAVVDAGLTKRIQDLIIKDEVSARQSKELATIHTNLKIHTINLERSWKEHLSTEDARRYFHNLGFGGVVERLLSVIGVKGLQVENVNEEEVEKAAIALWVFDSEYTNSKLDQVLSFTNTTDVESAYKNLLDRLRSDETLHILKDIEEPLTPVLKDMSKIGVLVDVDSLEKLSIKIDKEISTLEGKIYLQAKEEFNINSPKQLGIILFDKLDIRSSKKTGTGQKTTKESVLLSLKDENPIVDDILTYRHLQKIKTTYIDVYKKLTKEDKRIHTTFIQHGTQTGRMSSKDPNMQNIPAKGMWSKDVRNVFVSEKGKTLISCDYSQIELRVAAILSGDEKLRDIFVSGRDIHEEVAVELLGKKSVTKSDRNTAKAINFGILYGMGAQSLRQTIGGSLKDAQIYIEDYKNTFKKLVEFLENTKSTARKYGFTETLFGRKRKVHDMNSKIPYLRAQAERAAINAPIQGTSADMLKIAMKNIFNELAEKGLGKSAKMLLQIHDELLLEVDDGLVDEVAVIVKENMERVVESEVPIIVNIKKAKRWGDII